MKTWLIAASAFGGIFALDIIRLSAIILKKNMGTDDMIEYIEREAAIESIISEPQDAHYPHWYSVKIKSIPTADVAPVQHGKWITTSGEDFSGSNQFLCYLHKHDECGFQYIDMSESEYDFCPHCGALMDGE